MHRRMAELLCWSGLLLAGGWWTLLAAGQGKPEAKPSSYAPAKDLKLQVDTLMTELEEDLKSASDYGEDQQARVAKNASTLSAAALVLGLHDEATDFQKSAPATIAAAKKLASASKEHKGAAAALAELKTALSASGEAKSLKWEAVADLGLLMKAVPVVNNNLRRGVDSRRFAQTADKNAALAATLAAIAQVSANDTTYCDGKEDEAKWGAICGEMRDAASATREAIRKSDQEGAKAALTRLVKTCDDCHHKFRD